MCGKPIIVSMLQDATLATERNGAPVVYWLPQALGERFLVARGVRFEWTLLEIGSNTALRIVGRNSVDGRVWSYFGHGTGTSLFLDGTTAGITSLGRGSQLYSKGAADFGPSLQIGVMITTTDTGPKEARLSMTATALFEHFSASYGVASAASISGTSGDVGSTFDGSAFDEVALVITWTGAPTSLVFYLEESGDGGTTYAVADQSASLGTMSKGVVLQATVPTATMKLSYTAAAGGTAATATLVGRVK